MRKKGKAKDREGWEPKHTRHAVSKHAQYPKPPAEFTNHIRHKHRQTVRLNLKNQARAAAEK